jgi:hypothetical protein
MRTHIHDLHIIGNDVLLEPLGDVPASRARNGAQFVRETENFGR